MKIIRWWCSLNSLLEKKSSLLSAWASVMALLGIPLLLLGSYGTWIQITSYLQKPDIEMKFGNHEDVTFSIINTSEVLAKDPQYAFALWDLDDRAQGVGQDPGNLSIPSNSTYYIRPNSIRGPVAISTLSKASNKVPKGHYVFGWASIQCSECVSVKEYWILIKKGESAWYSEIRPQKKLSTLSALSSVIDSGKNYMEAISKLIPESERKAVPTP